jgi:hypothetical protein
MLQGIRNFFNRYAAPEPAKKAKGRLRVMKLLGIEGNPSYSASFNKHPKLKGALIIYRKRIYRVISGVHDDGTYTLSRIK